MTTLPITPELRAEAEVLAIEAYTLFARFTWGIPNGWLELDDDAQDTLREVHTALLADLTRPASMDAAAHRLAKRVGLTVGATAPSWRRVGGAWLLEVWNAAGRDGWQSLPSTLTDPAGSMRAELAYTEPK